MSLHLAMELKEDMTGISHPHAVFSYGTLRGDCGPAGDQWGLLRETNGTWHLAKAKGFKLYQHSSKTYPFVVQTGNLRDVVIGTLLQWPDSRTAQVALNRCDRIEGCNPKKPEMSLYQRCVVEADISVNEESKAVSAWIYYQSLPTDLANVVCIKGGDWLARNLHDGAQREVQNALPRGVDRSHFNASDFDPLQDTSVPVFSSWLRAELASGNAPRLLVNRIGAAGYVTENASDDDMRLMLEAFAINVGSKACEFIRKAAAHSQTEPGIPFAVWLQERRCNHATAKQVLSVLRLPMSGESVKSDEELWEGLTQLSKEQNAWKIIASMACREPLREAPPRQNRSVVVDDFDEVASLIEQSSRILVLTGAGISASSGIPTFRDGGGFYAKIAEEFGLADPEEINDIKTFRQNPLPWFRHIQAIIPTSAAPRTPSLTHKFIRLLESRGKLLWQYTQNIDCLEEAAGITRATFCHGSFATATCIKCGHHVLDGMLVNDTIAQGRIPHCNQCGDGVVKPDVVLFNEPMPKGVREGIEEHTGQADLLLVLGTSLKVTPCSLIPSLVGASGDASRVLINAELAGRDSDFEHFLEGSSDTTVQRILAVLGWTLDETCAQGKDRRKCTGS
mmetsp:Transcript_30672/g.55640  ORF Transcript_30672/g.55640 Transcript_30672/m.55640 type:complete len:621 (+) Transcript_30672:17-1879(+)